MSGSKLTTMRHDSLYRQCRLRAGPPVAGRCFCLRGRGGPVACCRLSCAGGGVRSWCSFGNGGGSFHDFRRSESDDPSQVTHDHWRAVADRAFWARPITDARKGVRKVEHLNIQECQGCGSNRGGAHEGSLPVTVWRRSAKMDGPRQHEDVRSNLLLIGTCFFTGRFPLVTFSRSPVAADHCPKGIGDPWSFPYSAEASSVFTAVRRLPKKSQYCQEHAHRSSPARLIRTGYNQATVDRFRHP